MGTITETNRIEKLVRAKGYLKSEWNESFFSERVKKITIYFLYMLIYFTKVHLKKLHFLAVMETDLITKYFNYSKY